MAILDFESGITGWTGTANVTLSEETTTVHGGTKALRITVDDTNVAFISGPELVLDPGWYKFSFWATPVDIDNPYIYSVLSPSQNNVYSPLGAIGEWVQHFSHRYVASADPVQVSFRIYNGYDVIVDDISYEPISSIVIPLEDVVPIQNLASNWGTGVATTDQAHTGTYSWLVTSSWTNNGAEPEGLSAAGFDTTISCWAYSPAGSDHAVLGYRCYITGEEFTDTTTVHDTWQQLSVTIPSHKIADDILWYGSCGLPDPIVDGGNIYVDDFEISWGVFNSDDAYVHDCDFEGFVLGAYDGDDPTPSYWWWDNLGTEVAEIVDDFSHSGTQSMHVTLPASVEPVFYDRPSMAMYAEIWWAVLGGTYEIACWVYVPTGSDPVTLTLITEREPVPAPFLSATSTTYDQWERLVISDISQYDFEYTAYYDTYIYSEGTNGAEFWIDDLTHRQVTFVPHITVDVGIQGTLVTDFPAPEGSINATVDLNASPTLTLPDPLRAVSGTMTGVPSIQSTSVTLPFPFWGYDTGYSISMQPSFQVFFLNENGGNHVLNNADGERVRISAASVFVSGAVDGTMTHYTTTIDGQAALVFLWMDVPIYEPFWPTPGTPSRRSCQIVLYANQSFEINILSIDLGDEVGMGFRYVPVGADNTVANALYAEWPGNGAGALHDGESDPLSADTYRSLIPGRYWVGPELFNAAPGDPWPLPDMSIDVEIGLAATLFTDLIILDASGDIDVTVGLQVTPSVQLAVSGSIDVVVDSQGSVVWGGPNLYPQATLSITVEAQGSTTDSIPLTAPKSGGGWNGISSGSTYQTNPSYIAPQNATITSDSGVYRVTPSSTKVMTVARATANHQSWVYLHPQGICSWPGSTSRYPYGFGYTITIQAWVRVTSGGPVKLQAATFYQRASQQHHNGEEPRVVLREVATTTTDTWEYLTLQILPEESADLNGPLFCFYPDQTVASTFYIDDVKIVYSGQRTSSSGHDYFDHTDLFQAFYHSKIAEYGETSLYFDPVGSHYVSMYSGAGNSYGEGGPGYRLVTVDSSGPPNQVILYQQQGEQNQYWLSQSGYVTTMTFRIKVAPGSSPVHYGVRGGMFSTASGDYQNWPGIHFPASRESVTTTTGEWETISITIPYDLQSRYAWGTNPLYAPNTYTFWTGLWQESGEYQLDTFTYTDIRSTAFDLLVTNNDEVRGKNIAPVELSGTVTDTTVRFDAHTAAIRLGQPGQINPEGTDKIAETNHVRAGMPGDFLLIGTAFRDVAWDVQPTGFLGYGGHDRVDKSRYVGFNAMTFWGYAGAWVNAHGWVGLSDSDEDPLSLYSYEGVPSGDNKVIGVFGVSKHNLALSDPETKAFILCGNATVDSKQAFVAEWHEIGVSGGFYQGVRRTFQVVLFEDQSFEINILKAENVVPLYDGPEMGYRVVPSGLANVESNEYRWSLNYILEGEENDTTRNSLNSFVAGRHTFPPILYATPARIRHVARGVWEGVLNV